MDNSFIWENRARLVASVTADLLQQQYPDSHVQVELATSDRTVPYKATISASDGILKKHPIEITFSPGYQYEYDLPSANFEGVVAETADAINWSAWVVRKRMRLNDITRTSSEGRIPFVNSGRDLKEILANNTDDLNVCAFGDSWDGYRVGSSRVKSPRGSPSVRVSANIGLPPVIDNYLAFAAGQEKIYAEKFVRAEFGPVLDAPAIVPSKVMGAGQSGYFIVLRYPAQVTDRVAEVAQAVARITPAIAYDSNNIHTTVVTANVKEGITSPDSNLLIQLEKLVDTNSEWMQGYVRAMTPMIHFSKDEWRKHSWAMNADSVILPGRPNSIYTNLVQHIQESVKNKWAPDLEVKQPWGGHITVARFTEPGDQERSKAVLAELCKFDNPPSSAAAHLDIGHFNLDKNGFRLDVYKSFKFII